LAYAAAALALGTAGVTSATASPSAAPRCAKVAKPPAKSDGGQKPPKAKLDPKRTYDLTFVTNCGAFTVRLDVRHAPNTTASFVSLARKGFFDKTIFHRIIPGFVIQGGDPTGTGSGGPGYSVDEPPPRNLSYTSGIVAMAKTAAEPPGRSGSQFFVVTVPDAGLTPDYALVGRVINGFDVVQRIEQLGTPSGTPKAPVVIRHVSIKGG
jgi:cyclophilin family peptidyl-prolyl cis-trans isomerase